MEVEELKSKILEKVKSVGGGVSFVELQGLEGFAGDLSYGLIDMNLIFWVNMSDEAIDALQALVKEGSLVVVPTTLLVYMIDGQHPKMPVAKQVRSYKSQRWLPVVFNLSE